MRIRVMMKDTILAIDRLLRHLEIEDVEEAFYFVDWFVNRPNQVTPTIQPYPLNLPLILKPGAKSLKYDENQLLSTIFLLPERFLGGLVV